MRRNKKDRQVLLTDMIETNPFITDEELADKLEVSIQTIRLDRLELSIPELRERIKMMAEKKMTDDIKSLPVDEIIGEIIDIEMDHSAISLLDIRREHVFKRNGISRGHHLFAQANSLAVAVTNDELALTAKANIQFTQPVHEGDRVIAKARVLEVDKEKGRSQVAVQSYVGTTLVFKGEFNMYRATMMKKDELK